MQTQSGRCWSPFFVANTSCAGPECGWRDTLHLPPRISTAVLLSPLRHVALDLIGA